MQKLFSLGKPICDLTKEEASKILSDMQGGATKIYVHGEALNTRGIEIKTVETTEMPLNPSDMPTEMLKDIIANFEADFDRHNTGEIVHNHILGTVHKGIVDWAMSLHVISDLGDFGAVTPMFSKWNYQFKCMKILKERRDYAKKKELERLNPMI